MVDGSNNVIGGVQKGNRLASVPDYQVAATATYYLPWRFAGPSMEPFIAASVQHIGSRYTQPSDQVDNPRSFVSGLPFAGATGAEATVVDLQLDPYTIFNLSAGLESDTWGISLYVNNVTDENADLSFDRERGGRARLAFNVNQPRTFGVTLRRNF